MSNNEIIKNKDDHLILEDLYRKQPKQFSKWFAEAFKVFPDSDTFKTWDARLNYQVASQSFNRVSFILMLVLCAFAGVMVKLPDILSLQSSSYYPYFIASVVASILTAYFIFTAEISVKRLAFIVTASLLMYAFTLLLPPHRSSSVNVALFSLPMVHITLLAYAFMGEKWKTTEGRLQFVHYIGEVLIYTLLILMGGVLLTMITLGVFGAASHNIFTWYQSNIVPIGMICSIIVATFVYDAMIMREGRLASIIANIFSPLLLASAAAFLFTHLTSSPLYLKKETLFVFNGLLVIVWGTTIYSLHDRVPSQKFGLKDLINTGLIVITILINLLALSAILLRISDEYGLTASRAYLLGSNMLIMLHLLLILKSYIQVFFGSSDKDRVDDTIARYLPVYSIWSFFSAVAIPVLFWFK